MPLPFRNPVSDDSSENWTPPSYAGKALEDKSSEKWTPPSYAGKAIEDEKPKRSVFSKAADAIDKARGPDEKERKDTNAVGFDQNKWSDIASKLPEKWHGIPIRQPAAFLGSLGGTALETLSDPSNIAAMGAGLGVSKSLEHSPEPSIRQPPRSTEIPYKADIPLTKESELPIREPIRAIEPKESPIKYDQSAVNSQGVTTKYKLKDQTPDKQLTNPFEKPAITQQKPITHDEQVVKSTDYLKKQVEDGNITQDAADKKQAVIDTPPKARFVFNDPMLQADQYNIEGGPFDKSTKGEQFIKDNNIPITTEPSVRSPEVTANLKEAGAKMQEQRNLAHRTEEEATEKPTMYGKSVVDKNWTPPDYAGEALEDSEKPTEYPSFNDKLSKYIGDETGAAYISRKGTPEEIIKSVEPQLRQEHEAAINEVKDKYVKDISDAYKEADLIIPSDLASGKRMLTEAEYDRLSRRIPDEKIPYNWDEDISADFDDWIEARAQEGHPAARKMFDAVYPENDDAPQTLNDKLKKWIGGEEGVMNISRKGPSDTPPTDIEPPAEKYDKSAINSQGMNTKYKLKDNTQSSLRKLLNSIIEQKGASAEQQESYRAERAQRFSNFESTSGEGVDWAKKAMSTLKGEYEKVNPGEGLGLNKIESGSLFSTIKNSDLDAPQKARGIAALFKLMNGESILQPNEIDVLDRAFSKHLGQVSGLGTPTTYDIKTGAAQRIPDSFSKVVGSRNPNDFLTKLANFSTKSARSVLGFHIPGTAVSFHGFNEAVRNTVFGSNFNPFKAAGRFADSAHYLANPKAAQRFLDINADSLSKAINEGGLRAATGDIGLSPMFKGDNFLSKGFNALTNPKPLFGQVIPALKLKSYNGLLEQYEKSGIPHVKAAKMAGYATNNIFGGLNLKDLERSQTTQKLFRVAALAPDWLESNARLGKGMFDSIKHPLTPQNKVYQVGMANFLGSYIGLNVINALNNDGKFSFQNEVGHELDVAIGKDSKGKVRYFSPYGTSMDMIRIPLEIAHAAVGGNLGRTFSTMRSRASEPIQFATDLMTNTDYSGRALYDKTKYGKPIPPLTQGANIAGDAAGHFLPIGAEAGVNLAQGKVSPEQFAAQVLQLPIKYKTPSKNKSGFSNRMRLQP
jgi:hypothetical protein